MAFTPLSRYIPIKTINDNSPKSPVVIAMVGIKPEPTEKFVFQN